MTRRKSIITLTSVHIGTVIGAGFASGQEIMQFFGIYGIKGILGVFVSTILLIIITSTVLQKVYRQNIHSFEEFANSYFNKTLCYWLNIAMAFLLLIGYFVMLAGAGAVVEQNLGINPLYGIIIMSIVNFTVFQFGVRGIANANKFIVPILISIIFFVGFFIMKNNNFVLSNKYTDVILNLNNINVFGKTINIKELVFTQPAWFLSAFVYAAHNSIGATVVMTSLRPLIYDEKAARYSGVLGGLGLGLLALVILMSLLTVYTDIIGLEVPMIGVAHSLGKIQQKAYSLVLILAMFTTAIANGYASILRFSFITGIKEGFIRIIICLTAIPLALLGFKNLVSFFYPIFGYIGLIFIIAVIVKRR